MSEVWHCGECGAMKRAPSTWDPSICIRCAGETPAAAVVPVSGPVSMRGAYDSGPGELLPGQGGSYVDEFYEQRAKQAAKWRGH